MRSTYFSYKILLLSLLLNLSFIHFSLASENNIKIIDSLSIPDELPFFDSENKKHYFDEYDGKIILVVFWASWCSSCTKEMPELDILQKDFRKLPFKIIALSQDYKGFEVIKQFYKTHEIRQLEMFHDQHNSLFKAFKVVGLPSAFLLGENGKIIASFTGNTDWHRDEVRDFILSYLTGQKEAPKNSYQKTILNQFSKEIKNKSLEKAKDNPDSALSAPESNDQSKK